jgi:HEAT repeat protein
MSRLKVREAWLRMCKEVSSWAIENKRSQEALLVMAQRYRTLSQGERDAVDELLAEQLASEDESVRFDALALIQDLKIRSSLPALRQLADWLETQASPGAPYEWAKVNRIIGGLTFPNNPEEESRLE